MQNCGKEFEMGIQISRILLVVFAFGCSRTVASQDEARRPLASQTDQEFLAQRLLDLSRLEELRPEEIAATLRCELGLVRDVTKYRQERDLSLGSDCICDGTVITGGKSGWVAVSLKPAPPLGLTLQDLEPLFLDVPYLFEPKTGHFSDGPRVVAISHYFRVKAGMLVVDVPAGTGPPGAETYRANLERAYRDQVEVAAGERLPSLDPVVSITLTNEPKPGLEKASTLRALREWAKTAK